MWVLEKMGNFNRFGFGIFVWIVGEDCCLFVCGVCSDVLVGVDYLQGVFGFLCFCVFCQLVDDVLLCFVIVLGVMGGDDQVWDVGGQQWIVVFWWFDVEYVGGGVVQVVVVQGVGQCLFVDQVVMGGIDQEGVRFYQCQFGGVEYFVGVFGQWVVQGQGVDLWQEFVKWQVVCLGGLFW